MTFPPISSDSWLAALVESNSDAIISKALDGIVMSWNASAERTFGYTADEMVGQSILKIIPPERHDEEALILDRIGRGERIEHFETKRRRKDGALVEISLTVSPIMDEAGIVLGVSKIARDISEARRSREMQRFLMREVNHRSKNLLAVVEAMVRRSARQAEPAQFAQAISARVSALSRTQDLIVQGDWLGVELYDLVFAHASVVHPERLLQYAISGPNLRVSPGAAQALGLALHELFSGSCKRLGQAANGRVTVSWSGDLDARYLEFSWSEHIGGNPTTADEFAQDVLSKVSPVSLNGVGTFSVTDRGWQWSVSTTSDVVFGP